MPWYILSINSNVPTLTIGHQFSIMPGPDPGSRRNGFPGAASGFAETARDADVSGSQFDNGKEPKP
jgi:hypothetical protein